MRTLVTLLLLSACDAQVVEGSGTGTLELSFRIDDDWRAEMDEPAVGRFWGSFYRATEVSNLGPNEGAEPLGSIEVTSIDLSGELTSATLFTSEPLPVEWVAVLGFMDSDANADVDDPDPDVGDPVTLPNDNLFQVFEDQTSPAEVYFGLLNPL